MRELPDNARQDSTGSSFDQDEYLSKTTGWELTPQQLSFQSKTQGLVERANRFLPLTKLFSTLSLTLDYVSASGWNYQRLCPFPDHPEKTPSFHFNSDEERFYCFGCQRGGKSVEFLSYLEGRTRREIAQEILSSEPIESDNIIIEDHRQEIEERLLKFADFCREYQKSHPDNLASFEKINQIVEIRIRKDLATNKRPDLQEFNSFLDKLEEKLK